MDQPRSFTVKTGNRKPVALKAVCDNLSLESAKQHLPEMVGCSLTKDEVLHNRWVVKYPKKAPPWSTSCAFLKAGGEAQALKVVLAWVWELHTFATGEPCPWDLEL